MINIFRNIIDFLKISSPYFIFVDGGIAIVFLIVALIFYKGRKQNRSKKIIFWSSIIISILAFLGMITNALMPVILS